MSDYFKPPTSIAESRSAVPSLPKPYYKIRASNGFESPSSNRGEVQQPCSPPYPEPQRSPASEGDRSEDTQRLQDRISELQEQLRKDVQDFDKKMKRMFENNTDSEISGDIDAAIEEIRGAAGFCFDDMLHAVAEWRADRAESLM
jgi:hypothetical protein